MFLTSDSWNKFDTGFISFADRIDPSKLFSFQLCQVDAKKKAKYTENDFKVKFCSNLILGHEEYEQQFLYHCTKIYDMVRSKTKDISCEQRLCTEIRALNLSRTCRNRECFDAKVKEEFFKKCKECVGVNPLVYDLIYHRCYMDSTPLVGFKIDSAVQ